jgi:hypothetical protein
MKKLLLFTILLYGCQDNNEPTPVRTTHNLSVIDRNAQLYINGNLQNNINIGYIVNNGDEIIVTDFGIDSWNPSNGALNQGYVNCQVILDNVTIYEVHCNCDANFTKIIQ